jgi:hypothetical protein
VRGGSGWRQFRRKGGRGWTGSGRRASGGGGEAVGRGNLDGVEGSRRNPARKHRRTSVVQGKGKGKQARAVGFGSIYRASTAQLMGEGGREREVTSGAQDSRRRRRARRNGVAAARKRLPDVEERGTASEGNAGGGRRVRATRGARSRWCRAAGAPGRPAAGATRTRRGAEEIGGSGKTMEDPVAKSRKHRDLTVMYR